MTQAEALDILKMGYNVYLTGSAGSGKTYLLNQYIDYLRKAGVEVAVTASTGIAASHMSGQTIHSWSGLGIRSSLTEFDLEMMEEKKYLWERFEHTKVLIIDEVSMLHHYRLDLVDRVLRFFKRNEDPFGGLQVVLCGDFFQLPPISRMGEEKGSFIYNSDAWQMLGLKICYLTESHRHSDQAYIEVLNAIRTNDITEKVMGHLRKRYKKDPAYEGIKPTKLYTHNADVEGINQAELAAMEGKAFTYEMWDKGKANLTTILKSSALAPESLVLKKGAQVMFVKNNHEEGYVNGTLGTVIECRSDFPVVRTVKGDEIEAKPARWGIEEDGKVKAEIYQVPLRLAWAITIHKSQGMTLDAAEIDLSKSFERGMGYVALSRLKTLEGLKLMGLNDMALKINEQVFEFDQELQARSDKNAETLAKLDPNMVIERQKAYLKDIAPTEKEKKEAKDKKLATYLQTKIFIDEKCTLADIATKRQLKEETIIDHIEKLQEAGIELDIEYIKNKAIDPKKLAKIEQAFDKSFEKNGDYRLAPVKAILGPNFSYYDIRLVRLFIDRQF